MNIKRDYKGESLCFTLSSAELKEAYEEQLYNDNLESARYALYTYIGADKAADSAISIEADIKDDFKDLYGISLDDILDPRNPENYILPVIVAHFKSNISDRNANFSDGSVAWELSVVQALHKISPNSITEYYVSLNVGEQVRHAVVRAGSWDDARDKAIAYIESREGIKCKALNATNEDEWHSYAFDNEN